MLGENTDVVNSHGETELGAAQAKACDKASGEGDKGSGEDGDQAEPGMGKITQLNASRRPRGRTHTVQGPIST